MRIRTLLTASFLMSGMWLSAQTNIYVATNGSDTSSGTQASPVKTVEAALKLARKTAGSDTVYINIASGTYLLDKPLEITEVDSKPIVFQGDAQNKPILNGAIKISGWEVTPEGWWKCRVPEVVHYGFKFEQFFVNGNRAALARTPDNGEFFKLDSVAEMVQYKGTRRNPIYATQNLYGEASEADVLKTIDKDEDPTITIYHKWDMTRKPISFMNVDSVLMTISGDGMASWNKLDKGKRYFLSNYKAALTEPGEWFLDNDGYLYYIPREGEKPETAECFAPVLKRLLSVKGTYNTPVKDKIFRDISFEYTAYKLPKLGNDPFQAAVTINAALEIEFAENINFYNCEVQHTGNYGMWFREGAEHCQVNHCFLYDLGAGGIKIGEPEKTEDDRLVTKFITVENNIIQHGGYIFPQAVGVIIFNASDNKVIHNEISDFFYSGVSVGWTWGFSTSPKNSAVRNEIAYNHINHIGWGLLSDMGAIYTLGISPGTTIHNNRIHDVYSYDYGGWGIYTDEGSSHILIENNLVYGCKSGGFHQHYGIDNTIRNNIFAYSTNPQIRASKKTDPQEFNFERNIVFTDSGEMLEGWWIKDSITMDKNCYWNVADKNPKFLDKTFADWKNDTKKDKHSIIADPMFRDPLNEDFTFKSKKTINKIGFKPFDYTKAGVYGDPAWVERAKLPYETQARFKKIIQAREKTNTGYHNKKF